MALSLVTGVAASLIAVPAVAAAPASTVAWAACPEDVVAKAAPTVLECGTVPVPLDYRDPGGRQIEVMVSRLASTDPAKRRGILLTNPGGPGGTGLEIPGLMVNFGAPSSLLDAYDIIGMDPRGVGHSAPVLCGLTGAEGYVANIPPYAQDEAAVDRHAAVSKAVAEQCAANDTQGLIPHITTANTSRDLNSIRIALGERKASYFGASYGSALGAAYASMFPGTTDRIILDSNVGATAFDHEGFRRFGLGMEQTFPDFAAWAAARHDTYGLGRTVAEVRRNYQTLAARLDREPVNGIDGVTFRLLVLTGLYDPASYPAMAPWWQALQNGDAAAAAKLAAELEESFPDNALSSFLAVTCNDSDWSEDVATYKRAVAKDRKRYPLFGAAGANITPCAFWPYEQYEPAVKINDRGPRNILLIQNLRDPATPYVGAQLFREQFRKRSSLVTVDGSGHGVYIFGSNPCALSVGTAYLVDGVMPGDTYCAAGTLTLDAESQRRRADALDRLPNRF
ncbi:pimeloyl-ACP methyl ester carboxylesterase [Catenuloplanes nepalensis]|uniref:Pimeloyl-ACP methyl ester carboxylesterase n=1 Tax=Catenuloplanes nepalensis TaxID=587533 RepID=A0ABT9MKA6_9ACTN|nr:alpha/beta hydrolase [Catenuloplanes nepalensis]MDP9791859.1 pimeloyl-ACP methyl ester carboxylesterase [Catenuloplanes nepalensis]